jgi:3D (Asp-Asp-Asp) domain-containing protein
MRRVGLFTAAALLGLSPLLAGWVALAWGDADARAAVLLIEPVDAAPGPKISPGPRLPKGCILSLKPARLSRWAALVERGPLGERQVKLVKCLRPGAPAWLLKGAGPALDIAWPELAVARREMEVLTTGYDPGPADNGRAWVGSTRSGKRARFGIVAVDPKLIPLGTRVYVEGYGPGLAADVGGAIKGLRMDLCFNTSTQARAWGRRRRRVWIVDPAPKAERPALRAALDPPAL